MKALLNLFKDVEPIRMQLEDILHMQPSFLYKQFPVCVSNDYIRLCTGVTDTVPNAVMMKYKTVDMFLKEEEHVKIVINEAALNLPDKVLSAMLEHEVYHVNATQYGELFPKPTLKEVLFGVIGSYLEEEIKADKHSADTYGASSVQFLEAMQKELPLLHKRLLGVRIKTLKAYLNIA